MLQSQSPHFFNAKQTTVGNAMTAVNTKAAAFLRGLFTGEGVGQGGMETRAAK